ncbi:uncharacterized protein LOC135955766 [Calliphora vicina]|uniref:uncharacterized protein LOC135955766 n=1 Tax=Calliphora vicina TaxID=7373 RepID=UPI00325A48E3
MNKNNKNMFKLAIVILAMCLLATHAAVLRPSDKDSDVLETTTVSIDGLSTTVEPELTTIKYDDDLTTTTTERFGAISRDEEATILIGYQNLLDSAPAELIRTEPVEVEKSGRLLLLSTPKIAEKQKQPEENLEESDEENEAVENVTQIAIETTTVTTKNDETTTILNMDDEQTTNSQMDTMDEIKSEDIATLESNTKAEEKQSTEASMLVLTHTEQITKLYPINDTLYADNSKMREAETQKSSATIVDDQPKETLNSNFGSIVLEEPEADYVLVESEVLEGSYTDVDSELHLQPIVQSVEIVPSSLDDTLLINYVQSW